MIFLKVCLMVYVITALFYQHTEGSRILGLFVFPGKSHFMVFKSIMVELARRGHEVTVVSNFRIDMKLKNYTELVIEPPFDYWKQVKENVGDVRDISMRKMLHTMNLIGHSTTEYALQSEIVQNLINDSKRNKFDLTIVEQFYQDALLAIPYLLNTPVVSISTGNFESYMSSMLGFISPWAHIPHYFLPYSDQMSFQQRLKNCYYSLYSEYIRKFEYEPQQDNLIRKYISSYSQETIPSISELENNISLLLLNNFIPLDVSRPSVMNMISIGGVHVSPAKEVVWDVKQFMENSPRGVIYFSLGTNIKSTDLSKETIEMILNVLGNLNEYVLWKWDDEMPLRVPKNVKLKKWVSQTDVLAHPYVKCFITHGGMLSVQEAIYRNVPLIGIPFYGDQIINMRKVADLGIGIMIEPGNLTESSLKWAIDNIINDTSYGMRMAQISRVFRDRPAGPLETAMFWIEYVIRHKGAGHLKTSAVHLPWYTLYLVDVISFLLLCVLSFVLIIYFIIRGILYYRRKRKIIKAFDKIS